MFGSLAGVDFPSITVMELLYKESWTGWLYVSLADFPLSLG